MKIKNTYSLPEPLVKAISPSNTPTSGYSVTDIIRPPRIVQLTRRHWDEIEEDASERIWMLLGSAVHYILEKGQIPESLAEERLEATFDGVTIRGRPDLWRDEVITDYKVTSTWSVIFEPQGREEWHDQLNLYRWLYKQNGFETKRLEVCAILRDWQASKAKRGDYPPIPVVLFDIPIMPNIEDYIRERLNLHIKAEGLPDDDLPFCTPEERWEKPTTYALMKDDRKTAIKVFTSLTEAKKALTYNTYIVERHGEAVRCERYCPVKQFCNQYKEMKNGQ